MPTITADLGSNSVAVAALAGVVSTNVPLLLLGTDSGLVGPLDQGTGVTCTVTQGANTLVLRFADGTGTTLNANGVNLDLFAQFPLPLPTGFVQGNPADTIVWTGSTGGVAFAFSQAGTIGTADPPVFYAPGDYDTSQSINIRQGSTRQALSFAVPDGLAAGMISAVLSLEPLLDGAPFLPNPTEPTLDGQALALDGLTSVPPILRFSFPAGWGQASLAEGPWTAQALTTYSSGATGVINLNAVLMVYGAFVYTPSIAGGAAITLGNEPVVVGNEAI